MNLRPYIITLTIWLFLNYPAHAAGKLHYGSRVGMSVTVVLMQGLNTSYAIIRTKHTREDAEELCREYERLTPKDDRWNACIQSALATRMNDQVVANCKTGVFTNFYGGRRLYLGRNGKGAEVDGTKPPSLLKDLDSGRLLGDYSASGYSTDLQIFGALCPKSAPVE